MYVPASNAEHRPEVVLDFIEAHPFGALVTASTDGLFATHLPLVLDRGRGPHGTLEGHVARANPHHRQTLATDEALVIFTGPDAYVTPAWYAAKREHGKVVPTWNYVAVHAYGTLRFTDDPSFLRRHLDALTAQSEAGRAEPWAVSDAPADFVSQLAKAIVGFELTITRLEGKWKMSQNRSAADIDGVVRGLAASPAPGDRAVAEIVDARRPRLP
ncbi:MAG TPA: FMN-binding negative transcriptional regulator [Gemmatimonadaceae bacterium]|nr:FMN-binding negative transcriptional regulator [Gemmatimonadaceae bacterium]